MSDEINKDPAPTDTKPTLLQRQKAMTKIVTLFDEIKDPSDREWILREIAQKSGTATE